MEAGAHNRPGIAVHKGGDALFRILVVEDDDNLRQMICTVLRLNQFEPMPAPDAEEALRLTEHTQPDLVIADIMLPGMDGRELTRVLRHEFPMLPIMMVTALGTLEDKRAGFGAGADDYLTKPVDLSELILRVNALLRRAQAMTSHRLQVGGTVLDYDRLTVTGGGHELELPKKEFYLLFKLLSSPRQIFTRRQLMDDIWGMDSLSDERTVDVHVKRLREKCEVFPDFEIVTVRGLGYKAEKRDA